MDSFDSEDDALVGRKSKVNLNDMDYKSWRLDLEADKERLDLLLIMLKDITPRHDSKLQMLYEDLQEKFKHPINEGNKKVLIFTAFADTADYLYQELAETAQYGKMKIDCPCAQFSFVKQINLIIPYFNDIQNGAEFRALRTRIGFERRQHIPVYRHCTFRISAHSHNIPQVTVYQSIHFTII